MANIRIFSDTYAFWDKILCKYVKIKEIAKKNIVLLFLKSKKQLVEDGVFSEGVKSFNSKLNSSLNIFFAISRKSCIFAVGKI
jgi:hypothetical protein